MLLRTRISLMVLLVTVVVAGGLAFAALQREKLVREQYAQVTSTDRTTLWRQIIDNEIQRMEDKAWLVAENADLISSVAAADHDSAARISRGIFTTLRERNLATRLDVLTAHGELLFSSRPEIFPSAIISTAALKTALAEGKRLRGIGNDKSRNIAAVLGIPLVRGGDTVGVAIYASDLMQAVGEFAGATGSTVLLVNRRGRLLGEQNRDVWETVGSHIDVGSAPSIQHVDTGDRVSSVIVLPLAADQGSLLARLVTIEDITAIFRKQQRFGYITLVSSIAFILFSLCALSWYLSRTFRPLTDGVRVLHALSAGDLRVDSPQSSGHDEIGRMADAVNVLRRNLIAFDRFRNSRERQRRRQETFIRREMTRLADTLDDEARNAVLSELADIEARTGDAPPQDDATMIASDDHQDGSGQSDGLAMVALAFTRMSARVQDQNTRLREALATKSALLALQRELEIAKRVQSTFLPEPLPPSSGFQVTGYMKPAKEVGGDFYDYFAIDDHTIGIVVADVSGKGVPAALFMAMARTLIRATARHVNEPGACLASVNDLLAQNNHEQLFVTAFYGVLNTTTGTFAYANAGHNPPVLVDDGRVQFLESTEGIGMAVLDGLSYDIRTIRLNPDARVCFYTDGVTEALNPTNEEFGEERLTTVLRARPDGDADTMLQQVITAVEAFSEDAPQFDDITCVVLHFKKGTDAQALYRPCERDLRTTTAQQIRV